MHLAAIKRRFKVLILLAGDTRVEKRSTNKEGKTVADILQLDKLRWGIEMVVLWWIEMVSEVLMLMRCDRGEYFLSLEQEVQKQTTEEQIAENEKPPAKVQGGTGAAHNIVDFEELKKYNVVVMTLITTVTFAAAFQVPGGYDGDGKANLVESRDFKIFLIFDTFSFGSSAFALLIYFAMPLIQKMTFPRKILQQVAAFLSMISLTFMIFAFSFGVAAVLDKKSDLYDLTNISVLYGWAFPILLFGIIYHIFRIPLTYIKNKLRPFRS